MKSFALSLILIFFPNISFNQLPTGVTERFDQAENSTIREITIKKATVIRGAKTLGFLVHYSFDGEVPRGVIYSGITIVLGHADTVGDAPQLRLIIDDKDDGPYAMTKYKDYMDGDEIIGQQFFVPFMTDRLIKQMASARTVKGRIGSIEFLLPTDMLRQIKSLYSSMPKHAGSLSVAYDSKENLTRVVPWESDAIRVRNTRYFGFAPQYQYPGKARTGAVDISINLEFLTNPPIEKEKPLQLKLWLDEKEMGPFTANHVSSGVGPSGTHQKYQIIEGAAPIIEAIANANRVRGMLYDMEFTLTPESLAQIKMLWADINKKSQMHD